MVKFLGTKLEAVTGNIKVAVAHPETKKVDVNSRTEILRSKLLKKKLVLKPKLKHLLVRFAFWWQSSDSTNEGFSPKESALIISIRLNTTVVTETTTGNIQVNQLQSRYRKWQERRINKMKKIETLKKEQSCLVGCWGGIAKKILRCRIQQLYVCCISFVVSPSSYFLYILLAIIIPEEKN